MFSTLKLSTLRSRSRSKEQTDKNIMQENPYDDNDDGDVSCASSLKCQQPFSKCE